MSLTTIIVVCILSPLLLAVALFRFRKAFTTATGFDALVDAYPSEASPPNTTMASFDVGGQGVGAGSVGANDEGLFLHAGLSGRGALVPWHQLQYRFSIGPFAFFKEQQTRLNIAVPKGIAAPFVDRACAKF